MAYRSSDGTTEKSKKPKFPQRSKMNRYKLIYDGDIGQMRAGFMNYKEYTPDLNTDIYWEVEAGYEYRIDLISKKFYNTAKYDWALEHVNNIGDPIKDVYQGRKLLIPSKTNILSIV